MRSILGLSTALAVMMLVTACRDRTPEKPTQPPLPTTSEVSAGDDEKPTLVSRIEAGGRASEYRAYFDQKHLARIRETYSDSATQAEYQFEGARLMRYASESLELVLDAQGRIERALENGQPVAPDKIEAIRTRANMLRSHALALHASRSHMH